MFMNQFLAVSQTLVMNIQGVKLIFVMTQLDTRGTEAASLGLQGSAPFQDFRMLC